MPSPPTYLRKVGALIEAPAFYPQLSGQDNLRALARLGQLNLKTVAPALARAGLTARAGDKYRSYSLGMKQRLGIAAALLPDPELLILDEPTNGLDPAGIVEMRGLIRSFADDGMTVLVSSHLISEIEQICDYVVMIRAGARPPGQRGGPQGDAAKRSSSPLPSTTRTSSSWPRSLRPRAARRPSQPAEHTVRIETAGLSAADLNRLAARNGITLRQLAEQTRSLERAFFALTGTDDAGVRPGQEMGAIK